MSDVIQFPRIGKITSSMMHAIMGIASEQQQLDVYLRCIGEIDPLESTYAMRAGLHMEPFVLDEYEAATGVKIIARQWREKLPEHPDHVYATIDGLYNRGSERVITEAKFLGSHMQRDDIIARYYPQVALQMRCANATSGRLIVAQGTNDLLDIEVMRDPGYEQEMLTRIRAWLLCIKTLSPPYPIPEPVKLPPIERWRTVDLSEEPRPNWGGEMVSHLSRYQETSLAAEEHDCAGKAARALVPNDVGLVIAGNWRIARNKRGTLSIRSNGQ